MVVEINVKLFVGIYRLFTWNFEFKNYSLRVEITHYKIFFRPAGHWDRL